MSEWQPIETAPRNGEETSQVGPDLLLYYPDTGMLEGHYFQRLDKPDDLHDGWETCIGFIGEPTHWMPLPPPPS